MVDTTPAGKDQRLNQKDHPQVRQMKAEMPLQTSCHLELDESPEPQLADVACCMQLISALQRIVKLGRVDVCLESCILSSHLAVAFWRGTPM
jgi:hypothetical protein